MYNPILAWERAKTQLILNKTDLSTLDRHYFKTHAQYLAHQQEVFDKLPSDVQLAVNLHFAVCARGRDLEKTPSHCPMVGLTGKSYSQLVGSKAEEIFLPDAACYILAKFCLDKTYPKEIDIDTLIKALTESPNQE